MAYIGNQGSVAGFVNQPSKQDLTGASGGTLTLTQAVSSAEDISLFINHVRQEPTTSYTAVGTTVTLQSYTVAASDDIYVLYNGLTQLNSVPADGSITSEKLSSNINMSGTVNTGTIKEFTGTNTAMTIDSSGRILTPARPAFSGIKVASSGNTGITGDIVFDTVSFNVGSHYNTTSGIFLVPITGMYRFYFSGFFCSSDGSRVPANQNHIINLMTNASGSFVAYAGTLCNHAAVSYSSASFSGLIEATANDQLKITATNHIFITVAGSPEFSPRFSIELAG